MSVNNGIVVSRPSAEWTRQEPGPWRGRCTPLPSFCPGRSDFPGLNDSKKLTAKKRDVLFDQITATAEAYSIAFVTAEEIDEFGYPQRPDAGHAAGPLTGLSIRPDLCLIDGNRDHGSSVSIDGAPHVPGRRGREERLHCGGLHPGQGQPGPVCDRRCWTGSIPSTSLPKHKGYGTKLHYEMLDRYGPCPAHRRTFLKKWEARRT